MANTKIPSELIPDDAITAAHIDSTDTGMTFGGLTSNGNLLLNDPDPRIFLQTGSTHYNWKISAQDTVDEGLEISSGGSTDADATDDTYTRRVVIKRDGNVGIGTNTTPNALLTVNGGNNDFEPSSTGTGLFHVRGGASSLYTAYIGVSDNGVQIGHTGNNRYLRFDTNETERMRIFTDGDVSIGTTSNGSQLHVVSDESAICTFEGSNSTGVVINSNSGVCSIIGYDRGQGAYNDLEIRGQNGTQIYLDGSANSMGIGNTSPNSANILHVGSSSYSGYPYRHQNGTGSYYMGHGNSSYHHHFQSGASTGFYWGSACYAQGGFSTYSDERLKENITTIDSALDKVALMNGVTFDWIDQDLRGSGKQFGVTAQNMLEVDAELPKLVEDAEASQEDIDNEEINTQYYSMDYTRLTPFFIEAIKELKTKLEAAEARITELEG